MGTSESVVERNIRYARCQGGGHKMDDCPVDEAHPWYPNDIQFWVRCERCGMVRRDVWSAPYGETLLYRRYFPPPGYSYAKDERPERSEFRAIFLGVADSLADRRAAKRKRVA